MPGGRERLTDTKTQTLRLAPLGSYFDNQCPGGANVSTMDTR